MEQEQYGSLVNVLLSKYKEINPQYHCSLTCCCGVCDKFNPCLLDLLDKLKQHTENKIKKLL